MQDQELITKIRAGEVALLPTDTVYGLAASPNHPEAIEKIFTIKSRPNNMNLPIMVSAPADLEGLGLEIGDTAQRLLTSPFIPGALTLVLGFRGNERVDWLNGREEVAVRIPADAWLRSILKETGPLLVTSANKHGSKANMGNVAEILKEVAAMPDVVVDHGILSNVASTIVNCRGHELVVERQGQIPFDTILNWISNE